MEIEKELEKCQKQKEEYLNSWKRAQADLINYKKGEAKRLKDFETYVKEAVLIRFLPVLDNFQKAKSEIPESLKEESNVKGLLNIGEQIESFLKSEGFERIKSVGEIFNPEFHEAVETVEAEGESGKIVQELQAGYTFNGVVVRPAKVKVIK